MLSPARFAEFVKRPTPRPVDAASSSLWRWPGSRATLLLSIMIAVGIAFIMIGVPETAFETFFWGGAPVVLVIENVIRRLAHRRKARRLLRDGSWWIGAIWHPSNERVDQHDSLHDGTYELNGGAVRFQYQTADGTRYEAEAPCRYGRFVIEDRLRIDVVTHPKAPHRGVVFIPGEGLRFFEGKEVASSGAIAQPVGEIEAVIRDGLVRTIVEWTAWFGLVTTGVVVGSFVAVIACLAVFGLAAYGVAFLVNAEISLGLVNLLGAAALAALIRYLYRASDKIRLDVGKSVRVGDDGLLIGDRYVAFEDIDAVQSNRVRLHDGSQLRFRAGQKQEPEARRKHRAYLRRTVSVLPEGARRKDESLLAWSSRLGAMLRSGAGSFRDETLRTDDLWTVAENPRASVTERAGAAAALSQTGDTERHRIAELGQRIASPSLQRIFEYSAKGDRAAIEEQLAALEEEQTSSSRDLGRA